MHERKPPTSALRHWRVELLWNGEAAAPRILRAFCMLPRADGLPCVWQCAAPRKEALAIAMSAHREAHHARVEMVS